MVLLYQLSEKNYSHDGNKMKIKFSYKTLGISLDRICDEFKFPLPDYVKIDVDGLEHLILRQCYKFNR